MFLYICKLPITILHLYIVLKNKILKHDIIKKTIVLYNTHLKMTTSILNKVKQLIKTQLFGHFFGCLRF